MVTIGFEPETYSVLEGDSVRICVNVISGMLANDREVVVTLSTMDGTAMGE